MSDSHEEDELTSVIESEEDELDLNDDDLTTNQDLDEDELDQMDEAPEEDIDELEELDEDGEDQADDEWDERPVSKGSKGKATPKSSSKSNGRATPSSSSKSSGKYQAPVNVGKLKIKFSTKQPAKLISFDPVHIPMGEKGNVEKFISYRLNPTTQVEEILVKYKNMCYLNADWIPRAELESDKNSKNRVKRFLEKPSWELQWSEDEPYNPSFNKIDRLIDEGEAGDEVFFLVKWCALTYDHCSWEPFSFVEKLDADKIQEFHDRRVLDEEKRHSYSLPGRAGVSGRWKKLEESPVYKNENSLRSYQLEGLNWLMFCWYNKRNSILADEMGLGKTIQSTAFINELYTQEKIKGPFLVITPLSTMGNWEREIKTWTDMNVVVYHGNNTSRNLIVETEFHYKGENGKFIPGVFKFDVVLTTYEMAMSGAAQLRPIEWRAVILDEAHRLKNKTSKVSELLKSYKMEHRVLLTGTPLQNSLDELWALLNFLEPEKFASETHFKTHYGSLSTAEDVERLQGLLKPLMLRRLKEDVEKSIPVKEETIVEVELTTTQKKWYRSILEKNFSWLKQGSKSRNNVPNLINAMIELRKCCIHPWLLNGAEEQILNELEAHEPTRQFEALIQSSGKMVLLDKLLRKLRDGGHKVLIFSQMTKCLDLIQDYLRGRQWAFERIDGGVRGDLRQAAIDRFSEPGSDSFVFLLCTRAGGVGINLTAADTCIIFDSDWNPQNDLQAQSRCHRIGQKKNVKIYRLVTRNTYEQEMLNRASLKLGLDKAVLQRMDMQEASGYDTFDTKRPSALSNHEIEDLLKKGAYGAFMDDDASKQFCEEDIDQILERRTQTIRHDRSEAERGSIFSKASFAASGTNADVDVNDPDFWDKVKEKAQLEIVEPALPEEFLIMDAPRNRRQVQRFGNEDESEDDAGSVYENGGTGTRRVQRERWDPAEKPVIWTIADRNRLERHMMQHGFHHFKKALSTLTAKRNLDDVLACARAMVMHGLKTCTTIEEDVRADCHRALAMFPPRTEPRRRKVVTKVEPTVTPPETSAGTPVAVVTTTIIDNAQTPAAVTPAPDVSSTSVVEEWIEEEDDLTTEDPVREYEGEEVPPLPTLSDDQLPYPGATPKQKREYNSFLNEATKEYIEHLEKKSKSLLVRIALLYHIRNKNNPQPGMKMAKILGAPPADWWGTDQDRDLIIGVCKHGYQQYQKIWTDPEYVFFKKFYPEEYAALQGPTNGVSAEQVNAPAPTGADAIVNAANGSTDDTAEVDNGADDVVEAQVDEEGGDDDVDGQVTAPTQGSTFYIPTPTELGIRIRRIIGAQARMRERDARYEDKRLQKKMTFSRTRDFEFSKRQRIEFFRAISIVGVRHRADDPTRHDWSMYAMYGDLGKKPDDAMEAFFQAFYKNCDELVKTMEKGLSRLSTNFGTSKGDGDSVADVSVGGASQTVELSSAESGPVIAPKGEDWLTYDKAKKVLRRVHYFYLLRDQVLKEKNLEEKLLNIKSHGRHGVPKWWKYEYDKYFLMGCDRYGVNRWELFVQDDQLPFKAIYGDFLKSLEIRRAQNLPPEALVEGRFEERFWMKDSIGIKRFETLIDLTITPYSKRGRKRKSRPEDLKSEDNVSETLSEGDKKPTKMLKLKFKLDKSASGDLLDSSSSSLTGNSKLPKGSPHTSPGNQLATPSSSKSRKSTSKLDTPLTASKPSMEDGDDSGGDTDDMLEAASKRLSQSKKKKRKSKGVEESDMDDLKLSKKKRKGTVTPPAAGSISHAYGGYEDPRYAPMQMGEPVRAGHMPPVDQHPHQYPPGYEYSHSYADSYGPPPVERYEHHPPPPGYDPYYAHQYPHGHYSPDPYYYPAHREGPPPQGYVEVGHPPHGAYYQPHEERVVMIDRRESHGSESALSHPRTPPPGSMPLPTHGHAPEDYIPSRLNSSPQRLQVVSAQQPIAQPHPPPSQ